MNRQREYENGGAARGSRERDLVVMPNEYAYVSDQTKGNVNVHTGPLKTSLAGTDQLVVFDNRTKKFINVDLLNAINTFATAPEGWYLVLKNPADNEVQPQGGKADDLRGGLNVGRKVNIPGPASFALWPGQMVRTIKGHILRSNQYLVVRVYDEEGARSNWDKAVIKGADGGEDVELNQPDITMGKLFIIKGTEVSFYIPPTGVEVVRDENDENVRDALTLERLEYGILKDENGGKRYVKVPDVVFPEPTEVFVEKRNTRKFKAIELSPISGLYIKVIADYDDHKVGDELFITGKEQMIYFPREEHAIMKYGDEHIHFATAIPAGEGRYVLNRLSGEIRLERGPSMYLPDPRHEVLVRRVIDLKNVSVWFPGNKEAMEYNKNMSHMQESATKQYVSDAKLKKMMRRGSHDGSVAFAAAGPDRGWDSEESGRGVIDDSFTRSETYTEPRSITLNTKYEGAVMIDVWTGYAIKVVSKTGNREVIVGPITRLLEYDETLEHMGLSMGTPKSDDRMLKTSYLRVLNNKVSDIIDAVTKDSCKVQVALSYRVNFEGEKDKWFDVENYVKFLTDHMRSLGRGLIKTKGIEDFYQNPHDIIRDAFLGKQDKDGNRSGRLFEENGMRIYEVEVLNIQIGDKEIEKMLTLNQNDLVKQSLILAKAKRDAENHKTRQDLERQKIDEDLLTSQKEEERDLASMESTKKIEIATSVIEEIREASITAASNAEAEREKIKNDTSLEYDKERLSLVIQELQEEAKAVAEKGKAITPQFIHALQAFADKDLAGKLSQSMSPLAIIGGESIVEVFQKLLKGTKMEKVADQLFTNGLHEDQGWDTKQQNR